MLLLPERRGELEGSDSGGGEAERVPVGDLLHGAVEALDVVPLQHQDGLAGVDVNLPGERSGKVNNRDSDSFWFKCPPPF